MFVYNCELSDLKRIEICILIWSLIRHEINEVVNSPMSDVKGTRHSSPMKIVVVQNLCEFS